MGSGSGSLEQAIRRAQSLGDEQRYDEALDIYRSLIHEHPDEAVLYAKRGAIFARMRECERAVQSVTEALSVLRGTSVPVRSSTWSVHLGDYSQVVEDCARGIAVEQRAGRRSYSDTMYMVSAVAHLRLGDFDAAIDQCQQIRGDGTLWVDGLVSMESILAEARSRRGSE